MSQIKLKRFFFRSGCALRGGLAALTLSLSRPISECLKELLRKQTSKTARQSDRQTRRCEGRQTDRETDRQRVSHYVYAACDDDNKKIAYQMLLKRKQRQRLHAGTPSSKSAREGDREKYGKGEQSQNKTKMS